jgi:NhaP-type Na+/H+ or K+/H+ antiporter
MELLPLCLFISGLFELVAVYLIFKQGNLVNLAPTGLFKDEIAKDESVSLLMSIFLLILTFTRIHCALDIHSKFIYTLTISIHILECLVLVVYPLYKKRLSPKAYPIAFAIILIPTWMIYSYNDYIN